MERTAVLADNTNGYALVQNFIHCFAAFFAEFCPVKEHYVCTLRFLCFNKATPCLDNIVSMLLVGSDNFLQLFNIFFTVIVSANESVYRQDVRLVVVCLSSQFTASISCFFVVDD